MIALSDLPWDGETPATTVRRRWRAVAELARELWLAAARLEPGTAESAAAWREAQRAQRVATLFQIAYWRALDGEAAR